MARATPRGIPRVSPAARANAVLRAAILRAADDRHVKALMGRYGMRLGAARFVAGETLDECVPVLRRLAEQGLHANTTLLGESVRDPAEAEAVAAEYGRILERLQAERLPVNVALKLTHLGLDLDEELAYANVEHVVRVAERLESFVRIDMEQSSVVDATLRIYRRLREGGHERVGTVLQSYLYRTADDLESLLPLRPNLRFVKGAYLEPPELAYPDKADVDAAYARLVERALRGGAYAAIATHDESLLRRLLAFAEREDIPRDRFELQMLYGVRPELQLDLARRGYKVLVATPYGPEWYPYLMRRLAERPANLGFVVRNVVRR
jgi:proline dehydrogenase